MVDRPKARILGTGSYLPKKVLTNNDLEKIVDTTDEWITSRVGIKERRIAESGEASSDMGVFAAEIALNNSGMAAEQIDLIIVATVTPDYLSPSTATIIQAKIGAHHAAAFDLTAACSGYLYALSVAKSFVESGAYKNVLLVAAEKMSAYVDYTDRNTCILFGDGAAAAVISDEGSGFEIGKVKLGADGCLTDLIIIPGGGSREPTTVSTIEERRHYWKMIGREVFKHAVRRMTSSAKECLVENEISEKDVKWIIPHQANLRIIEAIAKNFGISMEQVYLTVHKYGNNSAPSVGIALHELLENHPVEQKEHLLLVAFGAGLTWGATTLTKI